MATYLLHRLAGTIPVLLLISLLVFLLIHAAPGDPTLLLLGEETNAAEVAKAKERWGLDQPLYIQYAKFIRSAAVGESLVSPTIAAKVLQRVRASSASHREAELIQSELSDREIQVLKLIANGKDNAMIAAELHISPKTVKNHISNILMKLQIDNRIQAAVFAVRSGIV